MTMKVISKEWVVWLFILAAILFFIGIYTGNEILLLPLSILIVIIGAIEWWVKD